MDRILLVEDDEPLAMVIEFSLKKEGFQVKTAGSAAKGYEFFRNEPFSLILLDVMLPDGNGYELCERIRSESGIPVIFLTACDEEVNVVQGLDLGGDDYIAKPFKIKELVSRIRATLRRVSPDRNGESVMTSGAVSVHPMRSKAFKNQEDLFLTPVELRLLSMFLQNPFQTLSREQILERLWDISGDFVNDNALSVFVRRLREKLEDDPSNPEYIVTVRGIGYKWNRRVL